MVKNYKILTKYFKFNLKIKNFNKNLTKRGNSFNE